MVSAMTNIGALVGLRMYAQQTEAVNRSMHRLATGKRINRAADDPAGLIAADNMAARSAAIRKQIQGLELAQAKSAATEGGYSVISDLLVDLETLVVAAANKGATTKEEREAMQIEADAILEAIDFTLQTSRFNGQQLFTGQSLSSLGSVSGTLEEGGPTQEFHLDDLKTGGALNLVDGRIDLAQELTKSLGGSVAETRAGIGTLQTNYYDREIDALLRELEVLSETESIIRDTDFAKEVTELVRAQILQEAALKTILIARDNHRQATLGLLA